MDCDFLIIGGDGDLALRKLYPALYSLWDRGSLPADVRILSIARRDLSQDEFLKLVRTWFDGSKSAAQFSDESWSAFSSKLEYSMQDATSSEGLAGLRQQCLNDPQRDLVVYLATPPQIFAPICGALEGAGLVRPNTRIVVEKPLGQDRESFLAINDQLTRIFDEQQVYRIDHYLGKETVQNLLALRFANMLFEPVWNSNNIDHVQITVTETVGLEGRADFYDDTGALRDMVQNHMLQLLALIAMEPPGNFDATAIRDEKVKVLRALRAVPEGDSVTGQYGDGAVKGEPVKSYGDDLGDGSDTETFVALKAHVDNWRWQGVPFYLRTGKRMADRRSEIVVQFKPVPHNIFVGREGRLEANTLIIRLQPEEYVRLLVMAKEPGIDRDKIVLREVPLDLSLSQAFAGTRRRIAYERLLLDLVEGDQTLFVRRDEVEAQWKWIDEIRETWKMSGKKPKSYNAGGWGPSAAIALTERDGVSWHD